MNTKSESTNQKIKDEKSDIKGVVNQGNIYHRFKLMGLSLVFSGLGQMQVNQRIKGSVFLLAPLFATIATIFSHTPSFLYLAFCMGLLAGPLILSIIYALFVPYALLSSPILWLGIPIKLLTLIDAWFLGGKKAPKPFQKKWLILFTFLSIVSLLIFHLKFSVITIDDENSTTYAEAGDTIIVLGGHSLTGGTLSRFNPAYQRGELVVIEKGSTTSLMRIIAFSGEKISLWGTPGGIVQVKIFSSRIPFRIFSTEYNEPCVLLNSDDSYSYCLYRIESVSKKSKYKIAHPQEPRKKIGFFVERTITVPPGEVFLLPDIRSNKLMGRILAGNSLRTISINSIVGRPLSVIWSSHHKEGIRWNRIGKTLESNFIE
jgi:hypothetical protein